MNIHHSGEGTSLLNQLITEILDTDIQKDAMQFRRNIGRIGKILSYEMNKSLTFVEKPVATPFGTKQMVLPEVK
jgi:uracil phosphoribosyltransferase